MQLEIELVGGKYVARLYVLQKGSDYETFGPTDVAGIFQLLEKRGLGRTFIAEELLAANPALAAGSRPPLFRRLASPESAIVISRDGERFRARVRVSDDPSASWDSPSAMTASELFEALHAQRFEATDIMLAFRNFDVDMAREVERGRDTGRRPRPPRE